LIMGILRLAKASLGGRVPVKILEI